MTCSSRRLSLGANTPAYRTSVVEDDASRQVALDIALLAMQREGLEFLRSVDSRVTGREGNREIFVLARKP